MQLPLVMVDHMDSVIQCDGVFMDNYFMMRKLMALLISKGYRRFSLWAKYPMPLALKSDGEHFRTRWPSMGLRIISS